LHHCARAGQVSTCKALLRLGADVSAKNKQELTAEELALECGHEEVASLLRRAAEQAAGSGDALRHEDGLGVLEEPPVGVVFAGLRESEPLRRAVNMAAGYNITPPLPVSRSMQAGGSDVADRVADVVRGSLQGTEFILEDVIPDEVAFPVHEGAAGESSALRFCGLLVFEPPGTVSPDAPGHWVALRRRPASSSSSTSCTEGSPSAGESSEYWRLDPVRGPFRLEATELQELLGRYRAWRVVQGPSHLREERAAKLAQAREEALAILRRKAEQQRISPSGAPSPAAAAAAA